MLKNNVLKFMFIVSMIIAIGFPLVSIKYIYPSFSNLLIKTVEKDAIKAGNYISNELMRYRESFDNKTLSNDFYVEIHKTVEFFDLMKLKIFLPSGEVIYSTDDKDVGKINEKSYFHEIVAQGETYSKIVKKGGKSKEGDVLSLDVIEIYVPSMISGKFDGAYEFYYDITTLRKELNQVVLWASITLIIMMLILLVVIVVMTVKSNSSNVESPLSKKSLLYKSPYYLMAMVTITIFIAEIIAMYVVHSLEGLNEVQIAITDSIILIIFIAPSVYLFLVKPLVKYLHQSRVTHEELSNEIVERKKAEEKLERLAHYDHLTQIPNRAKFLSHIERLLERTKHQSDYMFAVLFIDLDRFKIINDSLGHAIGDELLIEVAHRLEVCTRATDTISRVEDNEGVARFGGDEFAIFLHDIKDIRSASRVADRVQAELQEPILIGKHELYTSASIGIALSATGYENAEDILRDADSAMYRAKATGKAHAEIFDNAMRVKVTEMLQIESDLRIAVDRQQFMLYYQPIVSAADYRITGAEALIRWNHPEKGLISPADFIPIAEETGLISDIGEWVLRTAFAQGKAWQDAGYPHFFMTVNFSARQFQDNNLIELVKIIIRETDIPAQLVDIEITESIAMEKNSIKILNQLTAMGLKTSIDDFGTGYSSLGSLTQFPINTIKVDRAFIKGIGIDINTEAIIKAIIAMAHSLKMELVAEGVETKEQLAFLQSEQCDKIQGYLFSPAVPEEDFRKLLEKEKNGSPVTQKYSESMV